MKLEYLLIKNKDDMISDIATFKSFLESNSRIHFKQRNKIEIGKYLYSYKLAVDNVDQSSEVVFHLIIIISDSIDNDKAVEQLRIIDDLIRRINDCNGNQFKVNTIWDDISIYYARKLYPELIVLENLFRKIIYLFMTKTIGSKWFEKGSPEEVRKAVKDTAKKNNLERIETDHLYYADFNQLSHFFFGKYAINRDPHKLVEELKRTDVVDTEKIQDLIKSYEMKSNWDRYFSNDLMVSDLESKWKDLYKYRNMVAHSKRISKEDYKRAKTTIDELKAAFTKYIRDNERIDLSEEQVEAVSQIADITINKNNQQPWIPFGNNYSMELSALLNSIDTAMPKIPSDVDSVFKQLGSLNDNNRIKLPDEWFTNVQSDIELPFYGKASELIDSQSAAKKALEELDSK